MPGPTLQLKRSDFAASTGDFLGYGTDTALWDDAQSAAIYRVIDSGVRQFYYPPPVAQGEQSYEWSFLKPQATVAVPSGETEVLLPEDFGGWESFLVVTSDTGSSLNVKVPLTDPVQVRARAASCPSSTGRPQLAAAEPVKGAGGTARGQRWKLLVWPTPDAAYTLSGHYYLLPDALTASNPFCYGGAEHAETIKASCLAMAELERDDVHPKAGPRWAYWMQRLVASVSIDRRKKPAYLGKNTDRSDDWADPRSRHRDGVTTVYGTEY